MNEKQTIVEQFKELLYSQEFRPFDFIRAIVVFVVLDYELFKC
jgi:hypothetical protein